MKLGTDGFLFVDKPGGPSSFAVVSAVREAYHVKRAGHGGTLDPAASGLLVVALGSATRLLPYVPLEPKCYSFGVRFGQQTDTLDAAGKVIKTGGSLPCAQALLAALPSFCGRLMQVPPEYSAAKIDGIRAYHLARAGVVPVIAPRSVTVHSLRLVKYHEQSGEARFEAACSGGTYVRSLARDIAEVLGTCGYAFFVRRTALGSFHVDAAIPFDECNPARTAVIPAGEVLHGMPRIVVEEEQKRRIIAGCPLHCTGAQPAGPALAVDRDNRIVAVMQPGSPGQLHPVKVFPAGLPDSPGMRS